MSGAIQLPADLRAMLDAVRRVGRPRLVGGGVRDWLLGLKPKDFDLEVGGVDFETLHRALAPFGATDVVGRSFGVIKVRSASTGAEYDFSLPRRESKTGAGHRGFAVAPDPSLNDSEAAARRDFTVNAIALEPFSGQLIDPTEAGAILPPAFSATPAPRLWRTRSGCCGRCSWRPALIFRWLRKLRRSAGEFPAPSASCQSSACGASGRSGP
jgi:hypothetical protein